MDKNKPLERWHGAHHYSNKVHLFFVFSLFFVLGTFIWSYMELNNPRLTHYVNKPAATPTPKTTCTPRPSCFDSVPRCMMPETSDMCPPSITPTAIPNQGKKVFCTQEAKLCPGGKTSVGRTGPNCEFARCP